MLVRVLSGRVGVRVRVSVRVKVKHAFLPIQLVLISEGSRSSPFSSSFSEFKVCYD